MRSQNQNGFTLLEILVVLGIIAALATVIFPNLTLTIDSKMSTSLRNLTSQIRSSYDDAVFSGRVHRMVFDIKKGEYWVEQAPLGYEGRPPPIDAESAESNLLKRDGFKKLLEDFDNKAEKSGDREASSSTLNNKFNYSIRSIPVVQRDVLRPINWSEVSDAIIYKQSLLTNVVFSKFVSSLTSKPIDYIEAMQNQDKNKKVYAYIYFLPNGTTTATSIQFATKSLNNSNSIEDNGPKYTLNLSTLTGQSKLLEGFQNADFSPPKK